MQSQVKSLMPAGEEPLMGRVGRSRGREKGDWGLEG